MSRVVEMVIRMPPEVQMAQVSAAALRIVNEKTWDDSDAVCERILAALGQQEEQ